MSTRNHKKSKRRLQKKMRGYYLNTLQETKSLNALNS